MRHPAPGLDPRGGPRGLLVGRDTHTAQPSAHSAAQQLLQQHSTAQHRTAQHGTHPQARPAPGAAAGLTAAAPRLWQRLCGRGSSQTCRAGGQGGSAASLGRFAGLCQGCEDAWVLLGSKAPGAFGWAEGRGRLGRAARLGRVVEASRQPCTAAARPVCTPDCMHHRCQAAGAGAARKWKAQAHAPTDRAAGPATHQTTRLLQSSPPCPTSCA